MKLQKAVLQFLWVLLLARHVFAKERAHRQLRHRRLQANESTPVALVVETNGGGGWRRLEGGGDGVKKPNRWKGYAKSTLGAINAFEAKIPMGIQSGSLFIVSALGLAMMVPMMKDMIKELQEERSDKMKIYYYGWRHPVEWKVDGQMLLRFYFANNRHHTVMVPGKDEGKLSSGRTYCMETHPDYARNSQINMTEIEIMNDPFRFHSLALILNPALSRLSMGTNKLTVPFTAQIVNYCVREVWEPDPSWPLEFTTAEWIEMGNNAWKKFEIFSFQQYIVYMSALTAWFQSGMDSGMFPSAELEGLCDCFKPTDWAGRDPTIDNTIGNGVAETSNSPVSTPGLFGASPGATVGAMSAGSVDQAPLEAPVDGQGSILTDTLGDVSAAQGADFLNDPSLDTFSPESEEVIRVADTLTELHELKQTPTFHAMALLTKLPGRSSAAAGLRSAIWGYLEAQTSQSSTLKTKIDSLAKQTQEMEERGLSDASLRKELKLDSKALLLSLESDTTPAAAKIRESVKAFWQKANEVFHGEQSPVADVQVTTPTQAKEDDDLNNLEDISQVGVSVVAKSSDRGNKSVEPNPRATSAEETPSVTGTVMDSNDPAMTSEIGEPKDHRDEGGVKDGLIGEEDGKALELNKRDITTTEGFGKEEAAMPLALPIDHESTAAGMGDLSSTFQESFGTEEPLGGLETANGVNGTTIVPKQKPVIGKVAINGLKYVLDELWEEGAISTTYNGGEQVIGVKDITKDLGLLLVEHLGQWEGKTPEEIKAAQAGWKPKPSKQRSEEEKFEHRGQLLIYLQHINLLASALERFSEFPHPSQDMLTLLEEATFILDPSAYGSLYTELASNEKYAWIFYSLPYYEVLDLDNSGLLITDPDLYFKDFDPSTKVKTFLGTDTVTVPDFDRKAHALPPATNLFENASRTDRPGSNIQWEGQTDELKLFASKTEEEMSRARTKTANLIGV